MAATTKSWRRRRHATLRKGRPPKTRASSYDRLSGGIASVALGLGLGVALATGNGVANAEPSEADPPGTHSASGVTAGSTDSSPKHRSDRAGIATAGPGASPARSGRPAVGKSGRPSSAASSTPVQRSVAPLAGAIRNRLPSNIVDVRADIATTPSATEAALPAAPAAAPVTTSAAASAIPKPPELTAAPATLAGFRPRALAAADAPAVPATPSPTLWTVLAWVRREVGKALFNSSPSIQSVSYIQSQGVITGQVTAVDPDSAPLAYTTTQPKNGTVQVNSDGSFSYQPNQTLAAIGGQDSFQVTVSDAGSGFHLHGLLGLVTLGFAGHNSSRTITVNVVGTPTVTGAGYTIGATDPATGKVTGTIAVTSPQQKPLTYTTTAPAHGSVTVNPDGTWHYTPTQAARLRANLDPQAAQTDGFTVTVDDGFNNPVTVAVTDVPISKGSITLSPNVIQVGDAPSGIAVTAAGDLFVANFNSNTVSVIRAGDTTATSVNVGSQPWGTAASPSGNTVYVANSGGNSVSIIDTATLQVTSVGVGQQPVGVSTSADGVHVYVANTGSQNVSAIDTSTDPATVSTIPGPKKFLLDVAVNPDGDRLYITNGGREAPGLPGYVPGSVTVFDIGNATYTQIPVGGSPLAVAVNPRGGQVYVTNRNSLDVIDPATNQFVTVPLGGVLTDVAFSPDGTLAYFPDLGGGLAVLVVDTATNTLLQTIAISDLAGTSAVAVSPDGARIYATNNAYDVVNVLSFGAAATSV